MDEHPGLYRIEVNEGPCSELRVLNKPTPPVLQESVRYAQQITYARAVQLVGDRDPRAHEFSVQQGPGFRFAASALGICAVAEICPAQLAAFQVAGAALNPAAPPPTPATSTSADRCRQSRRAGR